MSGKNIFKERGLSDTIFRADVNLPDPTQMHAVDPAAFRKIVENRRSVRVYDGKPVPEAVMRELFGLALLAPNSSNLQPWEFYWVRSPEKRAALVQACFGQNAALTAGELVVAVGRIDRIGLHRRQMLEALRANGQPMPKMVADYYNKIVPLAYTVGPFSLLAPFRWLAFSILGLFRPVPREPLGRAGLRLWAAKSTALACENFMLAASAYGLDTCPMEGLDSHRVRKILELPRSAVVVMAISVGRRLPKGVYGPRVRFPNGQFVKEV